MRQWFGSAVVQIMACHIFGAKPLSKPLLGHCQLHKLQGHFSFTKNIVCKMTPILFRGEMSIYDNGISSGKELSTWQNYLMNSDVMAWENSPPHYRPFMQGIHRSRWTPSQSSIPLNAHETPLWCYMWGGNMETVFRVQIFIHAMG